MANKELHYCEVCKRTMSADNFYRSNNIEKYPDSYLNQCKKCITMLVDNWNPDTYLWILQEIDVPYVPEEWHKLLQDYGHDRAKLTGLTILGRYLSKMKLSQFARFRWADTEFLQKLSDHKREEAMIRQGYDIQEVMTATEQAHELHSLGNIDAPPQPPPENAHLATGNEDYFAEQGSGDDILLDKLTDEDKIYLRVKWGKTYKPDEQIWLEKLYNEMMESYDIQSAGHVDTLKIVCKTSLKANQLLDIGDIEGAMKMIKMYDQLMKSGKFTAAQNKAQDNDDVDSVGQIVAICEKDGYIPRFYTDGPQDKVDRVIEDLQRYTHDLVTEELGLGNLIENAVKQIQDEQDNIKTTSEEEENAQEEEDKLFDYSIPVISEEDFAEFDEELSIMEDEDYAAIAEALEEETDL